MSDFEALGTAPNDDELRIAALVVGALPHAAREPVDAPRRGQDPDLWTDDDPVIQRIVPAASCPLPVVDPRPRSVWSGLGKRP